MKSHTVRLGTPEALKRAWHIIANAPEGSVVTIAPEPKRDRSYEQNRLQFKWSTEVAQQCEDRSIEEVRHDWKLRHGVPILRRDDAQFRDFYDTGLKTLPLFEQKLAAMKYVPVTSLMSVKQMQEYLDTVQRESLQQGYVLTDPDRWSE